MTRLRGAATLSAAMLLTALTGCGSADDGARGAISVYAAASLKSAFTEIGERFDADSGGASVEFSFAGSSTLVTQLVQGAPAEVFASANAANMQRAAEAGLLAGDPVNFASNTLVIAVARGNPQRIAALSDLTRPGVTVVVCAPPVPCGAATLRIEDVSGVSLNPVSEESSVTDVLNKVTSGQADAGLVYVSDAIDAGDQVTTVRFPEAAEAVNVYPIAMLEDARDPDLARRFIDLVTGEVGQRILERAGFAKP